MIGQSHITETLLNEIRQNRLAQSFLFTGPRGVGKTTAADAAPAASSSTKSASFSIGRIGG